MTWPSSPSDPRIQCVGECVGTHLADALNRRSHKCVGSASTSASANTPANRDSRSIQCVGSASAVRRHHTTRSCASSVRRLGSPLLGSRRTRRDPKQTFKNHTPGGAR